MCATGGLRTVYGQITIEIVGCADRVQDFDIVCGHVEVAKREILYGTRQKHMSSRSLRRCLTVMFAACGCAGFGRDCARRRLLTRLSGFKTSVRKNHSRRPGCSAATAYFKLRLHDGSGQQVAD